MDVRPGSTDDPNFGFAGVGTEAEEAHIAHAAREYLLDFGWQTVIAGRSLHLVLDDDMACLLLPTSSAAELNDRLMTNGTACPVLELPSHSWGFLVARDPSHPDPGGLIPPGSRLLLDTVVALPPTRTPSGPTRWIVDPRRARTPELEVLLANAGAATQALPARTHRSAAGFRFAGS